jgi:hypothetical protein
MRPDLAACRRSGQPDLLARAEDAHHLGGVIFSAPHTRTPRAEQAAVDDGGQRELDEDSVALVEVRAPGPSPDAVDDFRG